jgi:HAD superfamily hydrolase (TIGR01549 family)
MTPEIYKELLCGNFHEEIEKINIPKIEQTDEEKKFRQKEYSEIKSKMPMFRGIQDLLEKLHKLGFIIILNTSAYNRNTLPLLEYSKIAHLFDFVATAELSKSKTEKFEIIKNKYKVDEKNILFIADTLGDIKEADLAHIPTIAVTWGAHDKSFFEREKHSNLIKIVDTVKELEDFIERY